MRALAPCLSPGRAPFIARADRAGERAWAVLAGKTVIITGASRGIGAAAAEAMAAEGAALMLLARSAGDDRRARDAAARATARGPRR